MDPALLSGIGSIIGGLGGIFGKKKAPTPADNIRSQAKGARQAAAEYGFNPLTMLQYGNPGGSLSSGSAPPLASIDLITGGLKEISDITSGDAERRRQADILNLDMAKLKLEQARSGVVFGPNSAADQVGGGSSLGRHNTAGIASANGTRVVSNPDRTSVMVAGMPVSPHRGWSDAEEIEKRYSDVVSWAYGMATVGADSYQTLSEAYDAKVASNRAKGIEPRTWRGFGDAAGIADNSSEDPRKWSRHQSRQKFGAAPDGFTADGKPFWKTHNGITFNSPNKVK